MDIYSEENNYYTNVLNILNNGGTILYYPISGKLLLLEDGNKVSSENFNINIFLELQKQKLM